MLNKCILFYDFDASIITYKNLPLIGIKTCREGCYQGGGYCDQSGQCHCNSGWSGTNCSVPDCPNECQNGACNVPNNCVCNDGWSGMNCTQPICHQKCNPTGGQCTAPDTCTCFVKWTGGLCDVPVITQFGMTFIYFDQK